MTSATPIEYDGEVYPLYSANLAITSSFVNGNMEANAAMRLVPTRIDSEGNAVTLDSQAKSVLVGTTQGISGPEQEAMAAIYAAVQNFINAKGL
jgi:hypothetical protein